MASVTTRQMQRVLRQLETKEWSFMAGVSRTSRRFGIDSRPGLGADEGNCACPQKLKSRLDAPDELAVRIEGDLFVVAGCPAVVAVVVGDVDWACVGRGMRSAVEGELAAVRGTL